MPSSALGPGREFALIRSFLRGSPAAGPAVRVGPGDDCAVVGEGIALSSDLSMEGVHFRREWLKPREIGWRAAAAALSDLAAVAARPIGVLASLAVPPADAGPYARGLMRGVRDAAESVGGELLGGDLTRSPGPVVLDVIAVGQAAEPVLRSGAAPGDELWVTGRLGGPGAFVRARGLGRRAPAGAREAFARPRPRAAEALWLAERGIPRAMIDLSDGLAADAGHLAAASRVAVELWPHALPAHPAGRAERELPLRGGEDYELLFAARALTPDLQRAFEQTFGLPLTRVGAVRRGRGVWLLVDGGRRPAGGAAFQHFQEG